MAKSEGKINTPYDQKNAKGGFGTHFKEAMPFADFSTPVRTFFETVRQNSRNNVSFLDAAGGNGRRFLNGVIYLSEKSISQVEYINTDLMKESLAEFEKEVIPNLHLNIKAQAMQTNLEDKWPFVNQSFDAVMMTWALHWMGKNHKCL